MEQVAYERYPLRTIVFANAVGVAIWAIGATVLSGFGLLWPLLYLAYCIWMDFRVLWYSCTDCYYYGRWCAFGKGQLRALLFKKGNPDHFACRDVSWKDLLPDFMVSLIPLAAGAVLLVRHFTWQLALLLGALLILSFFGNAFIRSKLACNHCRQREIGCPAASLFDAKRGGTASGP